MKCVVCGSNGWLNNNLIKQPDKYERWVGITDVRRCWRKCLGCGLWHHRRNYPLEMLEKIYKDGYRDPKFRGETIKQAFQRITMLPDNKSENASRVEWLLSATQIPNTMLDIGSGLGVFPHEMSLWGCNDIWCTESNDTSRNFIESLGYKCTKDMPDKKFDLVSLVHVLEHIEQPIEFLSKLHGSLNSGGKLFIEVPDAIEFERLPPFNDEFNSCHTHFYEVPTLYKVLGRANYNITDIHRKHYKERNLYRIMVICQKGGI